MAPLADRNIDALVLTTNLSDIKMRALIAPGVKVILTPPCIFH
jgi:hypothetical protein